MRLRRPIAAVLVAATALGPTTLWAAAPDKATCVAAYEGAQTARKDGKLRDARDKALVCAQAACPAAVRDDCTQWLAEIDKSMPTVVFEATDDAGNDLVDVEVKVDGVKVTDKLDGKAMPLDPGPHTLAFVRPGAAPVEQSIVIREGEKNRVVKAKLEAKPGEEPQETPKETPSETPKETPKETAPSEEPPTPAPALPRERPTPASVYALGAVGLVGLGVFTTFAVLGMNKKTELDNLGCKPNCPSSDVDTIKRDFLIGDLGLAVGVVSLGTAAILYFTRGEEPAPTTQTGWTWQIAPTPTGGMGVARLTF